MVLYYYIFSVNVVLTKRSTGVIIQCVFGMWAELGSCSLIATFSISVNSV